MSSALDHETSNGLVTLRYWASAGAAAGTDSDALEVPGPVPLSELVDRARAAHSESARFSAILSCCAVMVGDLPVTTNDPAAVIVQPGSTVEFLPPFAGG